MTYASIQAALPWWTVAVAGVGLVLLVGWLAERSAR